MNDKLIDKYIEAETAWGLATSEFKYDIANKYYDQAALIMNQIWALPDCGQAILTILLEHKNEFVRLGAATNLLSVAEVSAKQNLLKLGKSALNSEVKYNAKMVLKEWRAGRLDNVRQRLTNIQ